MTLVPQSAPFRPRHRAFGACLVCLKAPEAHVTCRESATASCHSLRIRMAILAALLATCASFWRAREAQPISVDLPAVRAPRR